MGERGRRKESHPSLRAGWGTRNQDRKRTDLKVGHYNGTEKNPKAFEWRGSFRHLGEGTTEGRNIDDEVGAIYAEGHADRIAAAGFADGGNVNRRTAVAADHVLTVLAVAFRAADAARVECHAPALRLLDNQKTKRLIAGRRVRNVHGEEMKIAILHFAERNAQLVVRRSRCG